MTDKPRQRFRPERTGIGGPLGELEADVMHSVWARGESGCLAAEVKQALSIKQGIALTTVLTTLDRLMQKGILRREREGKAHRYHAVVSKQELEQRIVEGVLNSLIARFPHAVATYFSSASEDNESFSALALRVQEMQYQEEEGPDA